METLVTNVIELTDDCPICYEIINPNTRDGDNIIAETPFFVIALNPRWSPHPGRIAICPKRHLGELGQYGFAYLDDMEKINLKGVRKDMTDALIESFGENMRERGGFKLIDYLVRPSQHPCADLFPSYIIPPSFAGYYFPEYNKEGVKLFPAGVKPNRAQVILGSFPKSNPDLIMPVDLRKKIVKKIQENIKY